MDIRIAVDSRELLFKICLANRLWQFNHFAANAHAAHLFDGTTLIRQIVRPRANPHNAELQDNSLLGKLLHFAQQFFLHRSSHFGTFHDDAHLITASIFLCLSCQPLQFLPSTRRSRSGRRARRTEPSAHTYDKHTLRNAKKNLCQQPVKGATCTKRRPSYTRKGSRAPLLRQWGNSMLKGRHLLDPTDFSPGELDEIFDFADQILQSPAQFNHLCDSSILATPVSYTHLTLPTIYSV